MKKFLALILALVMVMAMATTAMAATETTLKPDFDATPAANNTATNDVKVTVDGGNVAIVYQVDVEWDALEFTYSFGEGAKWNPDTHSYDEATDGWAAGNTAAIVLENHSNAKVNYAAKFGDADSSTKDGVTATLTNNTGTLVSADADAYRGVAGPKATINLALTGTPTVTSGTITVGTITVTISK